MHLVRKLAASASRLALAGVLSGCAQNPMLAALETEATATSVSAEALSREGSEEIGSQIQSLGSAAPAQSPSALNRRRAWKDIAYGSHREQGLDVHGTLTVGARRPVLVYIHGGAWKIGDKAHGMSDKPRWANDQGWIFVSLNYRLAHPWLPEARRPMHPVQIRDVAAGLGWVYRNIARYGGDPGRIALMGHSAGAHLATLAATHPLYLKEAGLSPANIRGVVANDSASYDLTVRSDMPWLADAITNAFGSDPSILRDASPRLQLVSGTGVAPMLVLVQGEATRVGLARSFHEATVACDPGLQGDRFQQVTARGYDHARMNSAVGQRGERTVTPIIETFLKSTL